MNKIQHLQSLQLGMIFFFHYGGGIIYLFIYL